MNYYPHHIGDFRSATMYLSRIERSIYSDLLDLYYDAEAPLTLDFAVLCRRVGARDDVEKTAVQQVLTDYFTQTEKGWANKRCDEEIQKYREGQEKSAAGGKAKASKSAASKVQAGRDEDSHQRGLSVAADAALNSQASGNVLATCGQGARTVREGCAQDASTLREGANQNQNHNKTLDKSLVNSTSGGNADPGVERLEPRRNVEISILLRAGGIKPMTAMHPFAVEWAERGVTDDLLGAAIDNARTYKPGGDISPNYLKPIIEQMLAGPVKSTQNRGIHAERAAVLDELTGRTSAADELRTIDGEAHVIG